MVTAKTLVFDIESTSLNAGFGRILCIGYGWYTEGEEIEPHIISIDPATPWDDQSVVEMFSAILERADIVVGHNIRLFDIRMINTRVLAYNLPRIVWPATVDTLSIARTHFKPHSRRLDALAEFLQLPHKKTPITVSDWARAAGGDPGGLEKVIEHCRADIRVTAGVYERIAPYMRSHPRRVAVAPADIPHSCRLCGGRVFVRKYRLTANIPQVQVQCGSCGRYDTRAMTLGERKEHDARFSRTTADLRL